MAVREDLAQDYQTLADQHSEELMQLLEDFGESQEDIFHQLMELGSKSQRAEAITVLNSDFVEQNESQPNPNDVPEITTTPINPTDDTSREEQHRDAFPCQEESSPEPQGNVPESVPSEPTTTMVREEVNVETDAPTKLNNEAPTDITPPPVHGQRMEPNILEILGDK